jgi:tetrahydromethanopterin S-methyltransferase subunit F
MTFKFVGAIRDIGHLAPHTVKALLIGFAIGFAFEVARKLLARSARHRAFRQSGRAGFAVGWLLDAVLLPSPYALSFGGFFDLPTSIWFACGGVLTSVIAWLTSRRPAAQHAPAEAGDVLPEDMSTSSLIGGGLIAGESLYTLGAGIVSLLSLLR